MSEPDPELLSLLEKVANPLEQVTLTVRIKGVYAPPEQWKITDEANPNVFGYAIKVLGQDFVGGKIEPRKLTQKQLKELEQKSKKGGKKETKEEEKPQEVDAAEEERKQRQWKALSQQERFYRTQEDPYKAFSLGIHQKQKQINFTKETIPALESQINNDAIEITLTRKPEMSEEDLQKLKKSKPKNLNVGELYPAVYKGIIKAKQLQVPGSTKLTQRVKLTFSGSVPDDGIKIQTDTCYISLQIQCSQPLTPQVKSIKPTTAEVIPPFTNPTTQSSAIRKLKEELGKSIRAISQEYVACFAKEKEHTEDRRHNSSGISALRLNQINKRKEIFLNQFVSSGKYNTLKQRMSKSIKSVIIDKFRKEKHSSSIPLLQINETLSQLNLFFQQQFCRTIDEFMGADSASIHEDLVLGYEHSRQTRRNAVAPICSESDIQREMRLAGEFQILERNGGQGQEYRAEKHYVNVLILSNYSLQAKQNYANFCLRCKKFNQAYVLYCQISEQSQQLQHKFIKATLLVDRRRTEQATALLTQMMEDPECQTANKISYNLLLSFMYQRQKDIKSSQKYLALAQRYYKIKSNPHLKLSPPENPYQLPKPKVPKPERYVSQLSHAESQEIRLSFVSALAELNLYGLVGEYLGKLEESARRSVLEVGVDVFGGRYEEALGKIEEFLRKGDNIRNVDYLMIKADICYHSDKIFECQQIFLHILQLKPTASKALQIYLRLGYIYLGRKSWQDAKQIFEKACQQKYNCSVAWLGLGIADMNLGRYGEAEEAINLGNIYDPLSEEARGLQERINGYQRGKYQGLTGNSRKQDD